MIKKNLGLIIAAVLILVGLIGALVCAIPSVSDEQKLINKYIKAIDDCDLEAVKECMPIEELSGALSIDEGEIFGDASRYQTKLDYLKVSGISGYGYIPEDAKEVKSITLVATEIKEGTELLLPDSTAVVKAIVKITYVDVNNKTVSFTSSDDFSLVNTKNGLKIFYI